MNALTVQDDLWIMVHADCGGTGLWNAEGYPIYPASLPIDLGLIARIAAWQDRYAEEESRHPGPPPWEAHGEPIAEVNAEGRVIGVLLKAALPAGYTIVIEDCDAWLRSRAGESREHWECVLHDRSGGQERKHTHTVSLDDTSP